MLSIRCTLLRSVFEGGRPDDPRRPEWPPSWMRLFSALVSVAEDRDDGLLEVLEAAPAPDLHFDAAVESSVRDAYVPTNRVLDGGHTTLIGRTNSDRSWARSLMRDPRIVYRWPDLELQPADHDRLVELCRSIPYFGRSTSPALIEVIDGDDLGEATLRSRPEDLTAKTFEYATTVRSPYPGSLAALRDAHERKYLHGEAGDPWATGRGIDYGVVSTVDTTEAAQRGPYHQVVVYRLLGAQIDGRNTVRVAHAMRRAVMSRADAHLATLHGHHDGDIVQCAFLGLPFVHANQRHADGHLLGMAVAVPELSPDEMRVLANALPAVGEAFEVTAGPIGLLRLQRVSPVEAERLPASLRPRRWTRPSRNWVTATPVVMDRFLKNGESVHDAVREAVRNARLPEPASIEVSRRPLVPGALDLKPRETLRRPADNGIRPYRHVRIQFSMAVEGPVVVGSMRHYGLGLFVPDEGPSRG